MRNQGRGLPTKSRTALEVVAMLEDEDESNKPSDTQYSGKNLEP